MTDVQNVVLVHDAFVDGSWLTALLPRWQNPARQ